MNDLTGMRHRKSKWDAPAGAPPPPRFAIPQNSAVDAQVSSLEAASAAAARINAMLISKGKLRLPAPPAAPVKDVKQKPVKPMHPVKDDKNKSETLVAEVEINEVPIQCRNMLTKGATQEEISRMTGAAVSTRGRYMSYADRATNNMGERPLYLCVQGPTKESIDRAVEHIKDLISESMQTKGQAQGQGPSRDRARSRFSTALSSAPANIFTNRPLGAPSHSGGPTMGGLIRAPGAGGELRGPSVLGGSGIRGLGMGPGPGPGPIVPPPAVQMAIQSAQTSGHYLQDKVFVGLENADPSFSAKDKIQGPGSSFLQHIRAETGANVYLRGRGSGFMEPTSGREAFENLYLYVTHPKPDGLQAAKKLCENLIATIQAEYMTHQSQMFQRSGPAIAAAHMIAPHPPRPVQPLQQQQPIQQPGTVTMYSQAPPTMTSVAVASTSLSQTLVAQQQAQAIMAAQRPGVSTAVTSVQQGVAYPHLHMHVQMGVPGHPGQPGMAALPVRAPQPVPAPVPPAPVPPPAAPQPVLQDGLPPASQAQLYAVQVNEPGHNLAQMQAQAAAQVAQVQAQVQAQAQAQIAQAQSQLRMPLGQQQQQQQQQQPALRGLVQAQTLPPQAPPQQVPPPQMPQQQQQQQQQQPLKRRFREDLPLEPPEHHPPPMNNLGVSPPGPGHRPIGLAGGRSSLLGLPGPEDRRLMPPPPSPQSMHEAVRKRLGPPQGLDMLGGGRLPSSDEPRLKRGRLVSYDTSGDSDEDEDASGRSRSRFDPGPRFQSSSVGGYLPPSRSLPPPPSSYSSASSTLTSSSSYFKTERRDQGPSGSPFWMARN